MAQAEIQEVLSVGKENLWKVITRYEDYPQFVEGCTKVHVERKAPGHARVTYHVSMMKDVIYTLDHIEDVASGRMTWSLVEGDVMKKNTGSWRLEELEPGKTSARYEVDVEFKIYVPGFVLSKLVKGNLPSLIKSFEKQARNG